MNLFVPGQSKPPQRCEYISRNTLSVIQYIVKIVLSPLQKG